MWINKAFSLIREKLFDPRFCRKKITKKIKKYLTKKIKKTKQKNLFKEK